VALILENESGSHQTNVSIASLMPWLSRSELLALNWHKKDLQDMLAFEVGKDAAKTPG
jgi:hypothetical protein